MQLLVDFYSARTDLMLEPDKLKQWILEAIDSCDMHPHGEPMTDGFPWPGSVDHEALSGFCFLEESSIDIHTWPGEQFAFLNIFSCKEFDIRRVLYFLRQTFHFWNAKVVVLNRGILDGKPIPATVLAEYYLEY